MVTKSLSFKKILIETIINDKILVVIMEINLRILSMN